MNTLRITVIKRSINQELIENYLSDSYKCEGFSYCEDFYEGQEFFVESLHAIPQNFCAWAWKDIHHELTVLMHGGTFPWMKDPHSALACCTDAFRPVIFKIDVC